MDTGDQEAFTITTNVQNEHLELLFEGHSKNCPGWGPNSRYVAQYEVTRRHL